MRQAKMMVRIFGVLGLACLVCLGCSTDSPTAPVQDPPQSPGGTNEGPWKITVEVSPSSLPQNSTQPADVKVTVKKVGTNQPPSEGTTIVVTTSLGGFDAGATLTSVGVTLFQGLASLQLFPGSIQGTAVVTATLQGDFGQDLLQIIEGVVASFTSANSNGNLSVQFLNTSTGNPTTFFWDFGDGATSSEENPLHVFPEENDYAVCLTASKPTSSDRVCQLISVTEAEPEP